MTSKSPCANSFASKQSLNWLRCVWLWLLIPFTFQSFAQVPQDPRVKEISKEILDLITLNLNQSWSMDSEGGMWQLDSLFNQRKPELELGSKMPIFKEKIKKIKKDVGLQLKSQYFYNHDPLIDFTDGQLDQQAYSSRIRAGVEWDILKSGLFANKNQRQQLEAQKEIESLNELLSANDDNLYFRYNIFIYYFNKAKIELLYQRRDQLANELDLLHQVYYLKGILYEDVINARGRLERNNVKISNYEAYNRLIDSTLNASASGNGFNVRNLPVLDVNLDRLIQDDQKDALIDSLDRLHLTVESLRERPVHDVALKVGFYQNSLFKTDGDQIDRNFSTWTLSVSVPTHALFKKKDRENMVLAKREYREQFNEYTLLNNKTEIINFYYEYQYKLEQYVEFMHKEMLYREKIRVEAVTQKDYIDIYRSLQTLKYLDVLRQIQLEMLDLKQQMYLKLLRIYGKTHHRSIVPFVKQINIADYYERLPANRTLQLDQKDLQQYNVYFIKNYLLTNDFEKLIIRTGATALHPEVRKLKTLLADSQVKVFVMTDNHRLIEGHKKESDKIGVYLNQQQLDGIVVDLTSGRMQRMQDSLQQFLLNLKNRVYDIHAISDAAKTKVAIQIPIDYPYISQLDWCSMVTLKLDNKQQLRVLEPIMKHRMIDPAKVHLAVRANRFKDRVELEGFIDEAVNLYQLKHIVIEGLSDFITLDAKALIAPE